jgi:hypothetical protein
MGQIIVISLAGSLFQNIGAERISQILPDLSSQDVIQLTTGIHSPIFEALGPDIQRQVVEHVTIAIRNVFILILAISAPAFIGSLFMSVSV